MSPALAAAILAVSAAPPPVDYTAKIFMGYGANIARIRSHAGASRIDLQGASVGEAQYFSPGQRARITAVRDAQGKVGTLWLRSDGRSAPAEADWASTGETQTIGEETCAVQSTGQQNEQRCVTADGVNLTPMVESIRRKLDEVTRRPVDAQDVAPPLELLDLSRWVPAAALQDDPSRDAAHDYTATFVDRDGVRTIRRSGSWFSTVQTGGRGATYLVNADLGVEITTSTDRNGADIWLKRFEPGKEPRPFPARRQTMQGRQGETVLGENCQWWSQSTSPDASDFECRAADGAVVAVGFTMFDGSQHWQPATSFKRGRVDVSSIAPEARYFQPQTYGLSAPKP
jgi:hypothetical protein